MDMQALSNKFGMPIKIISIKDFNDSNPKVQQMEPDGDFEVKQIIEEMILLNTGNYHFYLIRKIKSKSNNENEELQNKPQDKFNRETNEKENAPRRELSEDKSKMDEIRRLKTVIVEM